jgi:tetratricopeptide (TPR) repeat protein/O-antigen ligase
MTKNLNQTSPSKVSPKTGEIYEKISKGSLYLLIFLLPLFFLPWTANVLDFNKQALLIVLVFISIFAWILKTLSVGKFKFNFNRLHFPVLGFLLILLSSTIFSLWPYGSFWGWPQVTSDSFMTLFSLVLLYFLITNLFKKEEIFRLMSVLVFSSFMAILFGVLQLFGKFIFPFDFASVPSFNTIGTVTSLAIFSAVLLPLFILLTTKAKGFLRILFLLTLLVSIVLLILANFPTAWWLVVIGSALIITFVTQKREFFDNRWLILPTFCLVLSLFFIFFSFEVSGMPARNIEVFLKQGTSFDIGQKALKENPILGTGPGTFIYDFSKYKKIEFNDNPFWNVRFQNSGSKFLDIFSTTGVLGIISFLTLIALFIFYGIKSFFGKAGQGEKLVKNEKSVDRLKENKEDTGLLWLLSAGTFISFIVLLFAYFLHPSNLSLEFLFFLLIASFVALTSFTKKEIALKSSSLATLATTFVFTIIFIFGLGVLITEGQRYAADAYYLKGIKSWQKGESDNSITFFEKAVGLNSKVDLYWRELSQVYIKKINEIANRTDLPKEEISQQAQTLISDSLLSVKKATEINSKNVANWSVRGFIYQNMIGIIDGSEDWVKTSYAEALKLEPHNPYFSTQTGIALLNKSFFLTEEQSVEKNKIINEAISEFEKAIELKSDYAPACFQIAMAYQSQGKQIEAISQLEKTKRIAPDDIGLSFQLGLIYYQNKDYEKAKNELERTILLNPNYSNALYFLGLAYDKLGQNSLAIEKFRKVAELNPDNSEVQTILENLRNGRRALENIIEEEPPKIPIEEGSPEELQPEKE